MQSIFLHCNVRRDYMKFSIFHAKPTSSGGKGWGGGGGDLKFSIFLTNTNSNSK